jgi:pimeloyl-ACP methyl ester carboxylesterase
VAHSWEAWRSRAEPIESGGHLVAAYDLGDPDGRSLTFLHGFPSSSLDLAPVLDLLGSGWRASTLDLPGFGASAKPVGPTYRIAGAADAVERLWAHHRVDSTVLVAHDYGVSVGQELLARRADGTLDAEVTHVVWMNGGLYPDLHRPTLGQQLLADPEHGPELAAAVTEEMFVDGVRGTWGERQPMDETTIHEMWCSMEERGGVSLMTDLLFYMADRREHEARWVAAVERTDLPATFVWGDLDPVSGAHMIERVEQRVPHARIERLADVGHWPLLEAPDVVARAVVETIDR